MRKHTGCVAAGPSEKRMCSLGVRGRGELNKCHDEIDRNIEAEVQVLAIRFCHFCAGPSDPGEFAAGCEGGRPGLARGSGPRAAALEGGKKLCGGPERPYAGRKRGNERAKTAREGAHPGRSGGPLPARAGC